MNFERAVKRWARALISRAALSMVMGFLLDSAGLDWRNMTRRKAGEKVQRERVILAALAG